MYYIFCAVVCLSIAILGYIIVRHLRSKLSSDFKKEEDYMANLYKSLRNKEEKKVSDK